MQIYRRAAGSKFIKIAFDIIGYKTKSSFGKNGAAFIFLQSKKEILFKKVKMKYNGKDFKKMDVL